MSRCQSPGCGAEVIFVPSLKTGRRMILDAKPEKRVLLVDDTMLPHGLVGIAEDPHHRSTVAKVVDVFIDHHVTCPASAQWAGRNRTNPPEGATA